MRKRISGLMTLVCLLVAAASALAAGTTVTTFTPFADMDFAAQGYMDLITAWEDETGNMVEDYSGLEDDLFMEQMQEMVTAGRADLVVVPLGSGLTKDQLVSVDELLAAAPDCGARRMNAMAERDGSVLLAPVRFNWEALYVNADVLEANGIAVPTNYDELIIACASLAQKGILPLANAMCEWPEIVLDCTAMIGAPADQYGQQTSLDGAKAVTTALTQVGAFGLDPWNLTDEQAKQAFMEGAAAMRFDGSDLAELVPAAGARRRRRPRGHGRAGAHCAGRHAELWTGAHPRLLAGQRAPRGRPVPGSKAAGRRRRGDDWRARVYDRAGEERGADDRLGDRLRRAAV